MKMLHYAGYIKKVDSAFKNELPLLNPLDALLSSHSFHVWESGCMALATQHRLGGSVN